MKIGYAYLRWFRVLLLLTALMFSEKELFGEDLVIPGTGACEPILGDLAKAFNQANRGDTVIVPESIGSGGGITAVIKGQVPLARVARSLKESESQQGLVQLVFARDAVAFVVGRDVRIKNLTSDQLVAIFSGKIENWKDVGGNPGPVRVIVREPGDSSLIVIEKQMKGFQGMTVSSKAKVVIKDQATVENLDKYVNSIGYVTMSSAKWSTGGFKPIAKDSVAPTKENLLSGKYTLLEDYSFIYNKSSLTPLTKRFIDFVFSPAGTKIIESNGLLAVVRK